MATIIPLDNTEFTTPGEKRFYHFLRDALKPDSECLAWYSPMVDGLEPDFVVYTPEIGLVVFEVKDWVLDQIVGADQHSFTLRFPDGRTEKRTNPLQQARDYMFAILNRIKKSCPQLLSSDLRYQGKPRLPVECAVVFCNITREEFFSANLHRVLPAEKALFSDDLTLGLMAAGDSKAVQEIRERLAAMLPPRFSFQMSSRDLAALRDVLWPEVRIVLPKRAGDVSGPEQEETIRRLDSQQESLARRLDARNAILHGPAGSGKTLVLVHKAIQELNRLRKSGSDLPVLLVCFNLTLVHYLKRLLAGQQAPLGKANIRVAHFYDFCRSLMAESLSYENEDTAYYKLVVQMALEAAPRAEKYGAVFVDEGQDFSDDMMSVLSEVCAKDATFWIACDTSQNLYKVEQHWLTNKNFRPFVLRESYRATQKLSAFCEKMVFRDDFHDAALPGHSDVFSVQTKKGDPPVLQKVDSSKEGALYIARRINELHARGLPYSEMMVLYAAKNDDGAGGSVPEALQDSFGENGILATWVTRDARSKSAWDITTDSVSLSTIHSMKGLDARAVFVLGLDSLDAGGMALKRQRSLAYVAFTRARQHLDIVFCKETPLMIELAEAISGLRSR